MKKSLLMAALAAAVVGGALGGGKPDSLTWKSGATTVTLKDGTLTVSGKGAMEDYVLEWEEDARANSSAVWNHAGLSITAVVIGEGVTYIGENAFRELCFVPALTSITVAADNAHYSSENGVLFNKNKTTLIQYPKGKRQDSYIIPNSVTTIGKRAFFCCWKLASVTIPNSVTHIGERAFSSCGGLTSITIPSSVKTIGIMAFNGCDNLTSVTIENGVTTIESAAFYYCRSLMSITFPKSVTSIGLTAFEHCANLTSITVLNPRPPEFGFPYVFSNTAANLYVPARSYFAYRAADGWNEFDIKVIVTAYEVIALGILSALLLSAAVFVIVKKSRSR